METKSKEKEISEENNKIAEEISTEDSIKVKKHKTKKKAKRFKENESKKLKKKNNKELKSKKEKLKNKKEKKKVSKDKKETKSRKKLSKRSKIIISICITVVALIAIAIFAYLMLRPKFKDVQLELGTQEITIDTFLVSGMYRNNATSITDISQIDLSRVGETDVTLSYRGKEETVKLTIADTTPPEVIFQDLTKSLNYKIKAKDFIVEKNDLSKMQVEIIEAPEEITEYADYTVKISVKDIYGNETIGECKLTITWLIPEVVIELGESFSISNLVLDVEEFGDRIPQDEIDKVDTSAVGEYEIKAEYEGIEYISKVKVQDTTPPELVLKDISIYDDEKINSYKDFIQKVYDASGEPTTTLKTEINYSKIGTQEVTIEAVDVNGNKTEKTANFTIKQDNEGPVFTGLTEKTVSKNSTINYTSGVTATDAKDGKCTFTVDSNKVDVSKAGTYYATYTSKDKKGNTTTKKRKIIVQHNQEDTNEKFDKFYNKYLSGKSIVDMAKAIIAQIKYSSNSGGSDPVWYGLTEGKGNCYVHAKLMQKALTKAGYNNKLIYLTDKSHYWNLVKTDSGWRHIDATAATNRPVALQTDEEKLADPSLHGKTWDTESFPAAE